MAPEMRLSKKVAHIPSSETLRITAQARQMRRRGVDVVNFGAGEPDFDTPSHIKNAAIKAIQEGFTKYTPAGGTAELKEAIAGKLKKDNALSYDPSCIVVSCGAKHSLFNIFQAICQEGDEVIITAPYWLSYPEMIKLAGAQPVVAETDEKNRFKLSDQALERLVTKNTRVILLNTPSNPTGAMYTGEELSRIAAVAKEHDALLVSDEIYEKLVYDGKQHVSVASLGEDIFERTIVVNGVSKAYSMTGWRIGYAAGPAEIMKGIGSLQSHSTSNPCSISQKAALAALTDSASQQCVDSTLKEFQSRRDYMCSRIDAMPGLRCIRPEGTFYIFCNISGFGMDSVTFSSLLLEKARVAVIPGKPFGADDFVRLSFAVNSEIIKTGCDRIEAWLRDNRKKA